MYTIKVLIISVLIAISEARGRYLKGTISDDLDQKPADILTSLSSEITKSDVEITLSGKIAEDNPTDAVEANDEERNDDINEKLTRRKPDDEFSNVSSAEDVQKITHTSDDNASFIHVKEKIARQSSGEEYDEADDEQRDGSSDDFENQNESKQAPDDDKIAEEKVASEVDDSELLDKKGAEISDKSDSVGADDTQDLLKFDAGDVDDELPTQSRRMLSFDHKLLDAMNIPKIIEPAPLFEPRSGQNDYKFNAPGINDYGPSYTELRDGESEGRSGQVSLTNPAAFPPSSIPTLSSLSLFRSPGPPQPHLQLPDNTEKQSHSFDRSLLNPEFINNLQEHPLIDGNHGINQPFQTTQQFYSHPLEQLKPAQSLQQFHLPQTFQQKPPLQPSQLLKTFQSYQPSHSSHSFESWQPLQSYPSILPPQPSSVVISSSRSGAFQPTQMKINHMMPRLQDMSQPAARSEISNQFSGLFHRNWNWSM